MLTEVFNGSFRNLARNAYRMMDIPHRGKIIACEFAQKLRKFFRIGKSAHRFHKKRYAFLFRIRYVFR